MDDLCVIPTSPPWRQWEEKEKGSQWAGWRGGLADSGLWPPWWYHSQALFFLTCLQIFGLNLVQWQGPMARGEWVGIKGIAWPPTSLDLVFSRCAVPHRKAFVWKCSATHLQDLALGIIKSLLSCLYHPKLSNRTFYLPGFFLLQNQTPFMNLNIQRKNYLGSFFLLSIPHSTCVLNTSLVLSLFAGTESLDFFHTTGCISPLPPQCEKTTATGELGSFPSTCQSYLHTRQWMGGERLRKPHLTERTIPQNLKSIREKNMKLFLCILSKGAALFISSYYWLNVSHKVMILWNQLVFPQCQVEETGPKR